MSTDSTSSLGTFGRFAVVKLWPEIKAAEDECIARIKIAAQKLGVECVEIHADGSLINTPELKVSKENVDFVIHLHYDTPKYYDAFSFVALWNPLKFYHEWGYSRCSRNLTTHDDFLSCSSNPADHHVARMIHNAQTHLPVHFHLYHSIADIVREPSLGSGKLFYAGINWEAISGGKSRHQEVLKSLDKTGLLSIYGPKVFQGVKVWAGYDSYVREIPFDGISMLEEISNTGIALVLSSPAHKDAELMTNRLFESVAAGALVICDENAFAKRYFGDSLLYIDGRASVEEIISDITRHINWARTHSDEALTMIARAQEIFRLNFTLTQHLRDIYIGLPERKKELSCRQNPPSAPALKVFACLLMPEYSDEILRAHIDSIRTQEYPNLLPAIVIDSKNAAPFQNEIEAALAKSPVVIKVINTEYFNYGINPEIKVRRRTGEIIHHLLIEESSEADAFVVVAPNERLFSNHIGVLAGALQRDADVHCAATAALLQHGDNPVHSIHELIDFGHVDRAGPPGYGRFIFRISAIPQDIDIALPYLDGRPLAVLVGSHVINQQLPASIIIDLQTEFPERTWSDAAENEIIRDYSASAFKVAVGFGPRIINQQASAASTATMLQLVKRHLNRRWIQAQIGALRKQGMSARIRALKKRLSS